MEGTGELEIVCRTPSVTMAFRVTQEERDQIVAFAKSHDASTSDVIRSSMMQVGVIKAKS